jgi:Protein of unknown function (DUF2786)
MELSTALSMVRSLLERAEHDSTPVAEAQACRDKADMLMRKHSFDEAVARATKVYSERDKPDILWVEITRAMYASYLAEKLAKFCSCQIRTFVPNPQQRKSMHKVYGFKSDLRYFEILYTELMLHMAGVLIPRWDPQLSDEDNAYILHKMGLNWLQMGELKGWYKNGILYKNDKAQERWTRSDPITGELEEMTNWQLGSMHKRMFERACRARGEAPKDSRIAANGTDNYKRSLADGYVTMYEQRLRATEKSRDVGMELVLAGSSDDLFNFFKLDNPDLFVVHAPSEPCPKCEAAASGHCRDHPKGRSVKYREMDSAAYQRGVEHARTAPLGGSRGMGADRKAVDA